MYILKVLGEIEESYISEDLDKLRETALNKLSWNASIYKYIIYECDLGECKMLNVRDLKKVEEVRPESIINQLNFLNLSWMFKDSGKDVISLVYGTENITVEKINESTISVKVKGDKGSIPVDCCVFTDKNCNGDLYKHIFKLYCEVY